MTSKTNRKPDCSRICNNCMAHDYKIIFFVVQFQVLTKHKHQQTIDCHGLFDENMNLFCNVLRIKIRMIPLKHFHPNVYSFHSFGCCSFWNRYIFSSYLSSYSHFFGLHSYQPNWENMRYMQLILFFLNFPACF